MKMKTLGKTERLLNAIYTSSKWALIILVLSIVLFFGIASQLPIDTDVILINQTDSNINVSFRQGAGLTQYHVSARGEIIHRPNRHFHFSVYVSKPQDHINSCSERNVKSSNDSNENCCYLNRQSCVIRTSLFSESRKKLYYSLDNQGFGSLDYKN